MKYKMANRARRVVNLFIDSSIYFLLVYIAQNIIDHDAAPEEWNSSWVNVAALLLFFLYYVLLEYYTGQTIGKIITRTKVVTKLALPLTLKAIFIRTLCRLIPLEGFSFLFGTGWHDKFSNTVVVKLK